MKTFIITAAIVILWITVIGLATRIIEDLNYLSRAARQMCFSLYDMKEGNTGEWLDHQNGKWIYARCSKCQSVHDTQTNFCPNCGARMKKHEVKGA